MSSLHREMAWQAEERSARLGYDGDDEQDSFAFSPGWQSQRECLSPTEPFVALDFETTGFAPGHDLIIEIGAIRVSPGANMGDCFQRLIAIPTPVPRIARQLTGIDDELLAREGVALCDALTDLLAFIEDAPLVAYNAPFDLAFLNAACKDHDLNGADTYHSCALALARRAWPRLPSYKLAYVATSLGIDARGSHRALGDAHRAALVYRAATIEHLGIHHLTSEAARARLVAIKALCG